MKQRFLGFLLSIYLVSNVLALAPKSDMPHAHFGISAVQNTAFIIMAGGKATRLDRNKPAETIGQLSIYERILNIAQLLRIPHVFTLVSPVRNDWRREFDRLNQGYQDHLDIQIVEGDHQSWMKSLLNALKEVQKNPEIERIVILQGDHIPDLTMIAKGVYGADKNLLFFAEGVVGANQAFTVESTDPHQIGEDIRWYGVNYDTWDGGEAVVGWLIQKDSFESILLRQDLDRPIQEQPSKWRAYRTKYPFFNPNTNDEMFRLKRFLTMGRLDYGFQSGEIYPHRYAEEVLKKAFNIEEKVELVSVNLRNSVWRTQGGQYLKIFTPFKRGNERFLRELEYAQKYPSISATVVASDGVHRAILFNDIHDESQSPLQTLQQKIESGVDIDLMTNELLQGMNRFHQQSREFSGWIVNDKPVKELDQYFDFEMHQFEALFDMDLLDRSALARLTENYRDRVNSLKLVTNHGDYVPYNIYLNPEDQISKIIDGEQMVSAPRLRDLGILIVRLLESARSSKDPQIYMQLIQNLIKNYQEDFEGEIELLRFFVLREFYQDIYDTYRTDRDYVRIVWAMHWIDQIQKSDTGIFPSIQSTSIHDFSWIDAFQSIEQDIEMTKNLIFNNAQKVLDDLSQILDVEDRLKKEQLLESLFFHLNSIDLNATNSAIWVLRQLFERKLITIDQLMTSSVTRLSDENIHILFDDIASEENWANIHRLRLDYFSKKILDPVFKEIKETYQQKGVDLFLMDPKKLNDLIYGHLPAYAYHYYSDNQIKGLINQYRIFVMGNQLYQLRQKIDQTMRDAQYEYDQSNFILAKVKLDTIRGYFERALEASYYLDEILEEFYTYSNLYEDVIYQLGLHQNKKNHMVVIPTSDNPEALEKNLDHLRQELESFAYFKHTPEKFKIVIVDDSQDPEKIIANQAVIQKFRPYLNIVYWDQEKQRALAIEQGIDYWVHKRSDDPQYGHKGFGGIRNMLIEIEKKELEKSESSSLITHLDQDNQLGVLVLNTENQKEHKHVFNYFRRLQEFYLNDFEGIIHGDYSQDSIEGIEGLMMAMDVFHLFEEAERSNPDEKYDYDPDKRWYRRIPHTNHPQIAKYLNDKIPGLFGLQTEWYLPFIPKAGESITTFKDYMKSFLMALQSIQRGRYENRQQIYHPMTYELKKSGDIQTYQVISNAFGGNTTITSEHLERQIPYAPFMPRGEDIAYGMMNSIVHGGIIHLVNALEVVHERWSGRMNIMQEAQKYLNQKIYLKVMEKLVQNYLRIEKGILIQDGDIYPHEASNVLGQLNENELASMFANIETYLKFDEVSDAITQLIAESFNYFKTVLETYRKIKSSGYFDDERYWWNQDPEIKQTVKELEQMMLGLSNWGDVENFIQETLQSLNDYSQVVTDLKQFGEELSVYLQKEKSKSYEEIYDRDQRFQLAA